MIDQSYNVPGSYRRIWNGVMQVKMLPYPVFSTYSHATQDLNGNDRIRMTGCKSASAFVCLTCSQVRNNRLERKIRWSQLNKESTSSTVFSIVYSLI